MPRQAKLEQIREFFRLLYGAWGRQHWWPAESCLEVIVGAILTQNTAWTNVEKALANLRSTRTLSLEGIRRTSLEELGLLVRPAGYFRQKAQRLKNFVAWLDERFGGSVEQMFAHPTEKLRRELLSLNGIGPETADSILLYGGNHPVFVVDAYTRRILERHRIIPADAQYEEIRDLFEQALGNEGFVAQFSDLVPAAAGLAGACHAPSAMSTAHRTAQAQVFNEMHGLIVGVAKNFCLKSRASCDLCPLRGTLTRRPREYVPSSAVPDGAEEPAGER